MKRYIEYQREYEEYVRSCTEQGHQPSVQQYFFIAQRLLNDYGVQDALKEGGAEGTTRRYNEAATSRNGTVP